MCGVCGCGHEHEPGRHDDHHCHHHSHELTGSADASSAGRPDEIDAARRRVRVERDLLDTNDRYAEVNRERLDASITLGVNLMSSPGSGKTTLLCRTLDSVRGRWPTAVVEGDQQTDFDAERIRATGVPAYQVNTGKGCHLDARMLVRALDALPILTGGVLFIENVGNLVCPAGFRLGEHFKVVVVSVTEGEDKPLKYPDMFAVADLVLVNKVDLLPHLHFDLARLKSYIHRIKPSAGILEVSAVTGQGFERWIAWLDEARARTSVDSIRKRKSDMAPTGS